MSDAELALKMIAATEKLLHEVARLRRDISMLHGRIQPFNGEQHIAEPPVQPIRTMTEVLKAIDETRRGVIDAEYHLNAIRAVADDIAKDAISRTEMKPYLKG